MVAVSDKMLVRNICGDSTRASKQNTEKSLNLEGIQQRSKKKPLRNRRINSYKSWIWITTNHPRAPIGRPQTDYLSSIWKEPPTRLCGIAHLAFLSTFMNSSHSSSRQCVSLRVHSHQHRSVELQFVCSASQPFSLVWCEGAIELLMCNKDAKSSLCFRKHMQEVIDNVKRQGWTASNKWIDLAIDLVVANQ